MIKGQCFTCYDRCTFDYFGQTKEYNPLKVQQDYVKGLTNGVIVDCISCGAKKVYTENDGKWKEDSYE